MKNFKDIELKNCNFCGTCVGLCPTGAIKINLETQKLSFDKEKCINCGLCYNYCQGIHFDFNKLNDRVVTEQKKDRIMGPYLRCYLSHSTNKDIRKKGSSGGLITQVLVYVMENKIVDGVIIPMPNENKPWIFEPKIVKSIEEIKKAYQSKYCYIPSNKILKELKKVDGNYAIVLVPCQIHSIRKLQADGNKQALKLKYILGLVCGHNMSIGATMYGMRRAKVDKSEIEYMKFRDYGGWPGGMSFYLKDGTNKGINFFNYHYMNVIFLPRRCKLCPDFLAEYADISFGDSWLNELLDKGIGDDGIPLGWSSVISRTEEGDRLLQNAFRDKVLHMDEVDKSKILESFPFNIKYKKRGLKYRLKLTSPKPDFLGLEWPEDYSFKEKIYHLVYYGLISFGATRFVKKAINLMPEMVLVKTIYYLKKLFGYPENARDKVLKHKVGK